MTDETLQRFFHALVEALRERSPADLERPFTVAEIYQDLVPYRTHRDQLGVEMNGDYEHALLRLLAGEGGYLKLESDHALRDIRGELDEKAPNTTVYRDYAAVDVRIDPFVLRSGGGDPAPAESNGSEAPEVETPEDTPEEAPSAESAFFSGAAPMASEPEPEPEVEVIEVEEPAATPEPKGAAPADPAGADGHCAWCRSELPTGRAVHYCPYCGQDQSQLPCRSCGEALESDWQFCITCGAQAAS